MNGFTSVNFERDEIRYVINNIPAQVCPDCGEAYLDEDVVLRLLQCTEEMFVSGVLEDIREYETLGTYH